MAKIKKEDTERYINARLLVRKKIGEFAVGLGMTADMGYKIEKGTKAVPADILERIAACEKVQRDNELNKLIKEKNRLKRLSEETLLAYAEIQSKIDRIMET